VDRGARGDGELVRVATEVDPEIEITEITDLV
jgi:3-polyprenyl-4-hydroxybenzoate decarboxylase